MAEDESSKAPYLLRNNTNLDFSVLESRLAEILMEQETVPASPAALPSQQAPASGNLKRLSIRLRSSALVREWLPRHPRLYRIARSIYRSLKKARV
ncbi:hypothetical protein [Modicisalibacter sp. 'Wilcox']|uniref:hypothetical protein n=1 Tax=Modicisalibacter sp. 'Wilcox' TaxID=2679914 RepID=UPI0013D6FCF2|nr:hypothetical protein [Modicisalibacter sp. 'Wilcox']